MTAREKKIAIYVGAAIGLLGIYMYLLEPYFDRLSDADRLINEHQADLGNAQTVMQTRLRASRKWKDVAHNYLMTDSTSAERQLTNFVSQCAAQANLKINSTKAEKQEKEKGYDRYGYKPQTNGNMQQIARFLYELQTADIPLRVNDLTVNSRKDGVDDLTLSLSLSTIFQSPTQTKASVADATFGRMR